MDAGEVIFETRNKRQIIPAIIWIVCAFLGYIIGAYSILIGITLVIVAFYTFFAREYYILKFYEKNVEIRQPLRIYKRNIRIEIYTIYQIRYYINVGKNGGSYLKIAYRVNGKQYECKARVSHKESIYDILRKMQDKGIKIEVYRPFGK